MNSPAQPGFFRRFFTGLWNALNFTRMLAFNLVFLFFLLIFLGAMFASAPRLQPRTALVLDPRGDIVEQYRVDASERAMSRVLGKDVKEVQLRDLLRVIDAAAKDINIDRVVLVPDDVSGAGLATLSELGAALDRLRTGGKEVVVVSNGMGSCRLSVDSALGRYWQLKSSPQAMQRFQAAPLDFDAPSSPMKTLAPSLLARLRALPARLLGARRF